MRVAPDAENDPIMAAADDATTSIVQAQPILDLPEHDRFVFVMCVLEQYSIHDCALLLGKPPREIYEVWQRVSRQFLDVSEPAMAHNMSPSVN